MVKILEIYKALNQFAPFETAMDFDNSGLLIGSYHTCVQSVGVALDITEEVIEQAAEKGCDLIISHHPVIMDPLKSIGEDDLPYKLIRRGIAVISAHTNLDASRGGVNDCLAHALDLQNVRELSNDESGTLRWGELEQALKPDAFAEYVKTRLNCPFVEYADGGKLVRTVIVGGGSCGGYMPAALEVSADAMLTSEVKHHTWLRAKQSGLTLVDAGHFETESVVKPAVLKLISESFPSLKVVLLDEHRPTWFV